MSDKSKANPSNLISASIVKKALPSSMIYALVQSMTFMVDTIVSGHFLGTDAVAAIALGMPIIGLMLAFTAMILQGAFLKLINAMGRNDMEDYHRFYSLSLVFTFIVDIFFMAVCFFATDTVLSIAGAGKATEAAVVFSRLYIRTACCEVIFFAFGTMFQLVITTYGYQIERMTCSVVCVVVNVVSSIVLIQLLPEDIKIAGLGLGSTLGTMAMLVTAYALMRRKKIHTQFRFYKPSVGNLLDALDMLRRGFPASIDVILDSVSGSVVNNIILSTFIDGTTVLALVAIIKTINNVVRTVGRGVFYAGEPLIGILHGARDNNGIKKTFRTGLKYGIICAAAVAAILIIIKEPLLSFYNMSGNADASRGLILIAISGIILVVSFAFNAVYESSGHLLLSFAVSAVPDSILYPILIPVLSKPFGVTGVWLALGYNAVLFFAIFYLIFMIATRKIIVPLDKILRLKDDGDRVSEMDVSIPVDAKDVTFISRQLQQFLLENGTDGKTAYKVALCMEEIAVDYINHLKGSKVKKDTSFMDIKVFRTGSEIETILRNYDEIYNPLVFDVEEESFSKIGITMVQKICEDISYSYAYHLNIITIKIASNRLTAAQ